MRVYQFYLVACFLLYYRTSSSQTADEFRTDSLTIEGELNNFVIQVTRIFYYLAPLNSFLLVLQNLLLRENLSFPFCCLIYIWEGWWFLWKIIITLMRVKYYLYLFDAWFATWAFPFYNSNYHYSTNGTRGHQYHN